jgi:hypothetical protein
MEESIFLLNSNKRERMRLMNYFLKILQNKFVYTSLNILLTRYVILR